MTLLLLTGGAVYLGEQPANNRTATAAAAILWVLAITFIPVQISAVPPAAAQRLKECRSIGVAIGLCLHHADFGLLIGLLGYEQAERVGIAVPQLPLGQIQRFLGRSI